MMAALAVAACAAKPAPQPFAGVTSIALVVQPLTEISVSNVGVTAFGDAEGGFDGRPADLEGDLRHRLAAALAPRYRTLDLPFTAMARRPLLVSSEVQAGKQVLALPGRADLYLVVVAAEQHSPFGGRDVKLSGCGIAHFNALVASDPPIAYCILDLVAVDGKSGKVLAVQRLITGGPDAEPLPAHAEVPRIIWQDVDFGPVEIHAAEDALHRALAAAVPASLKAMQLAP